MNNIARLRDIEGLVREASTKLWEMTVTDPETATVASERAGLKEEHLPIRALYLKLDKLAEAIETIVNEQL